MLSRSELADVRSVVGPTRKGRLRLQVNLARTRRDHVYEEFKLAQSL